MCDFEDRKKAALDAVADLYCLLHAMEYALSPHWIEAWNLVEAFVDEAIEAEENGEESGIESMEAWHEMNVVLEGLTLLWSIQEVDLFDHSLKAELACRVLARSKKPDVILDYIREGIAAVDVNEFLLDLTPPTSTSL